MKGVFTQFFPPKPAFTEDELPDLTGKVYIVTGANTGLGKQVARALYSKNARVYIFARSEEKASAAIQDIKKTHPGPKGALSFIHLDLNDLRTIKASVDAFLAKEERLHVLFNNAGIMLSDDAKSAQGYEQHLGINCLGTFLLTKLLTPILVATAKLEPPNTVRVIWVASVGLEILGEKNTGIDMDNLDYHRQKPAMYKYAISKCGDWAYGVEFAKRFKAEGVVSLPLSPGNLQTELFREQGIGIRIFNHFILYPVINGACTQLYAGLAPEITLEKSGSWVIPFGRIGTIRKDLVNATKDSEEGGNGTVKKFWEWSEEQVKPYI